MLHGLRLHRNRLDRKPSLLGPHFSRLSSGFFASSAHTVRHRLPRTDINMRLLNTIDFTFKEFWTDDTPQYAILSHYWSQDANDAEVTYQQLLWGNYRHASAGWKKIAKCCEIAASRDLDWVWVDTCCINKDSSAELTEAINSMYLWYRNAKECYAFMDDVVDQRVESHGGKIRSCSTDVLTQSLVYQRMDVAGTSRSNLHALLRQRRRSYRLLHGAMYDDMPSHWSWPPLFRRHEENHGSERCATYELGFRKRHYTHRGSSMLFARDLQR